MVNGYHRCVEISNFPPWTWVWIGGLVFAAFHSGLACTSVKSYFHARGLRPKIYRLAYVILSFLATAVWLFFIHLLPDHPLYAIVPPWSYLLHVVQLGGMGLVIASFYPIDLRAFLGLRSYVGGVKEFTEEGVYRYLRHPMYSGSMVVMFAFPYQTANSLAFCLFVAAYFIVGARFEESRMIAAHPEYHGYRKRVPAFIPRFIGTRR